MALEGRIKILVTKKYLAATFDEKEILMLSESEDYARILARNGISEIVFDKGTSSTSIGDVLHVLAARGTKVIKKILIKNSMQVEILKRGQKIPEEIPDCVQMKVNAFIDQLALERFLKQAEHEETEILKVLEIILKIFKDRGFPDNFIARLSQTRLFAIENAIIRNVNQFRAIAPFFLTHPNVSAAYLICLIENEIVKDMQLAIDFVEKEGLTGKEKAGIILAAAKKMVIGNPESIFECLEKNLGKAPYRGSKYQEYVKEILWALVNSRNTRGLKVEGVKEVAEAYGIPAQEIEKYIVEMLKNGKIVGEETLAMAEKEFVPAKVVADVILRHLPKTGRRFEQSEEVIPARDEEIFESGDGTGNWLIVVETNVKKSRLLFIGKRAKFIQEMIMKGQPAS